MYIHYYDKKKEDKEVKITIVSKQSAPALDSPQCAAIVLSNGKLGS